MMHLIYFYLSGLRVPVILSSLQVPWNLLSSFQVCLMAHLIYLQHFALGVPIILG
jgi:hypothetical protein